MIQPLNTYTVSMAQFVECFGDPVAVVVDAVTGIASAHYRDGSWYRQVAIDTPLCDFCDRPSYGFCPNCDVSLAPVERLSPTRVLA